FHLAEYPLTGGSPAGIPSGIDADFAQMSALGYTTVRTYYSNYYGYDVAPIAAKYNMQLYLGVYMTNETWYQSQVDSAVNAIKANRKTVKAILVGNENVSPYGPYTVDFIVAQMNAIRNRIKNETGLNVPVGTVQRTTEWLRQDVAMLRLAANADVIGVNIYPFYDANSDPTNPLASLKGTWQALVTVYPATKLRITETGWPTAGTPSLLASQNVPSFTNAWAYYLVLLSWMEATGRWQSEDFWYAMYDARPDEQLPDALDYHFGLLTYDGQVKVAPKIPSTGVPSSHIPTPLPSSPPPTASTTITVLDPPMPPATTQTRVHGATRPPCLPTTFVTVVTLVALVLH
ncbi:hypothetical protein As57867_022702, partial [Aphanomyces stellatus]